MSASAALLLFWQPGRVRAGFGKASLLLCPGPDFSQAEAKSAPDQAGRPDLKAFILPPGQNALDVLFCGFVAAKDFTDFSGYHPFEVVDDSQKQKRNYGFTQIEGYHLIYDPFAFKSVISFPRLLHLQLECHNHAHRQHGWRKCR